MKAQLERPSVQSRRELARRVGGGIEVVLYWSPLDNSTTVEVWEAASEATLVFAVPAKRALEAFYHPFAQVAAPHVAGGPPSIPARGRRIRPS